MMKAIFFDRNNDLTRCQFAGMNEKGKPEWLIIEQGKPTETLAETEKEDHCNHYYKLLCLEGEEVGMVTLMRILCSCLRGELEGWRSASDEIFDFINDMLKHQVVWSKKDVVLRFRINEDFEHEGKYHLTIYRGMNGCFLGGFGEITDLDGVLEVIDDFCCTLEDSVGIEKVYSIVDVSNVADYQFSEQLLSRFDRVMKA